MIKEGEIMTEIATNDLSGFGYRELGIAGDLLKAYAEGEFKKDNFFGDGLTLNFNSNSGVVFLSDNDYNVGVLNDDNQIEQFLNCGECGNEGIYEDFKDNANGDCGECKRIIKENL